MEIILALEQLLEAKRRLLRISLEEGLMLSRDDPDFLESFRQAEGMIRAQGDTAFREGARHVLSHIRQFNPFNTSDVEDNQVLREVVEDFLAFTEDRIERLKDF